MSRRPGRGPARTAPESGTAGARGALLLAIAVVLGVVLLNSFDGPPTVDVGAVGVSAPTTAADGGGDDTTPETAVTTTTTTGAARAPGEVTVLVANGTDIRGLAGATATALKGIGYNTLSPTDTSRPVDTTKVLFSAGFEPEARQVASSLQLPPAAVEASSPANAPPIDDTLDANVIVLLGADVSRTTTTGNTTTTRR